MSGRLPNFLIIGAMRCGTTSLSCYLDAHPDVFVAPQKEVHYFDLNLDRGDGWYREQFAKASAEQAVGEATQTYMYDDEIPARMAALLPEARLISILRNPVDRAYSHYWHNRVRDKEPLGFTDAIAAEPARLLAAKGRSERYAFSYLDRGRYLRQLRRVCRHYPRETLSVLLFEELRDAPREVFGSVCRFLQVDPRFVPDNLGKAINPSVRFRSLRLRAFLKRHPLPSLARRVLARLNTRRFHYPALDPSVRVGLLEEFEGEITALEAWLGRELTIWKA